MNKSLKGIFNWQAITQLVFVVVAFLLVVWSSMGFEIKTEKLTDWNFWYICAIKLFAVLAIHNAIFGIYSNGLRIVEDSKYFVTIASNRLSVDRIYAQKSFAELDKAVEEENKDAYIKACNSALRNVTTRLSYSDINFDNPDIGVLCKKFLLGWWKAWRLKKVIKKIINGHIKYDIMVPDDILKDKDADKDKEISPAFDMRKFLFKQNISKAITFLVSTIGMTVITFAKPDMTLWQSLLTNSVLLLNSLISGISMANSYIKTRTAVFEQKNRFLDRRMGIKIEYPPK